MQTLVKKMSIQLLIANRKYFSFYSFLIYYKFLFVFIFVCRLSRLRIFVVRTRKVVRYTPLFSPVKIALLCPPVAYNVSGLGVGRGFAKARTGGELPNSCEVSHETTPRLTRITIRFKCVYHFLYLIDY